MGGAVASNFNKIVGKLREAGLLTHGEETGNLEFAQSQIAHRAMIAYRGLCSRFNEKAHELRKRNDLNGLERLCTEATSHLDRIGATNDQPLRDRIQEVRNNIFDSMFPRFLSEFNEKAHELRKRNDLNGLERLCTEATSHLDRIGATNDQPLRDRIQEVRNNIFDSMFPRFLSEFNEKAHELRKRNDLNGLERLCTEATSHLDRIGATNDRPMRNKIQGERNNIFESSMFPRFLSEFNEKAHELRKRKDLNGLEHLCAEATSYLDRISATNDRPMRNKIRGERNWIAQMQNGLGSPVKSHA